MLSYPISDAEALLREKLEAAKTALSGAEEDAEFLREQITVCSPVSSMLFFFFLCRGLRCGGIWDLGLGLGLDARSWLWEYVWIGRRKEVRGANVWMGVDVGGRDGEGV